jgi:hypothetical protein
MHIQPIADYATPHISYKLFLIQRQINPQYYTLCKSFPIKTDTISCQATSILKIPNVRIYWVGLSQSSYTI